MLSGAIAHGAPKGLQTGPVDRHKVSIVDGRLRERTIHPPQPVLNPGLHLRARSHLFDGCPKVLVGRSRDGGPDDFESTVQLVHLLTRAQGGKHVRMQEHRIEVQRYPEARLADGARGLAQQVGALFAPGISEQAIKLAVKRPITEGLGTKPRERAEQPVRALPEHAANDLAGLPRHQRTRDADERVARGFPIGARVVRQLAGDLGDAAALKLCQIR